MSLKLCIIFELLSYFLLLEISRSTHFNNPNFKGKEITFIGPFRATGRLHWNGMSFYVTRKITNLVRLKSSYKLD